MKKNILRISILPLIFLFAMSFTALPPQKDKGNKGENSQGKGNQNDKGTGNGNTDKPTRGNSNGGMQSDADRGKARNDRSDNDQGNEANKNKGNAGDRKDDSDGNRGSGKNNNGNNNADDNGKDKGNGKDKYNGNDVNKGNGKSRKENIQWDRDENINWGFDNYSSRKRPKDFKKVTVCHNTGDRDYPVTITVSENALKAHINHGDQVGNSTVNYSDRWPANFIRTRENVYNNYQTTWETMSYSEALVRFAAQKLLGIKSTFQAQRPTLTSEEIQRRELLINDLQNNVNSLENQLAVSKQRTAGLNININL